MRITDLTFTPAVFQALTPEARAEFLATLPDDHPALLMTAMMIGQTKPNRAELVGTLLSIASACDERSTN